MSYRINRKKSVVSNPVIVGLGLLECSLLFLAPFSSLWIFLFQIVAIGLGWGDWNRSWSPAWALPYVNLFEAAFVYWLIWAIPLGIGIFRWLSAAAKGSESDKSWEKFVNDGLAPQRHMVPTLEEGSGPSKWLETLNFPFVDPVTINLPDAHLAPTFSKKFEELLFKRVREHAPPGGTDQPAFGHVILHGKTYSLIFRQPDDDSIVVFISRIEVGGTVVSLICGGCGFIRRKKATGEKAQRWSMGDDRVYLDAIKKKQNWVRQLIALCVPLLGVLYLLRILKHYASTFVVNDSPFSWVRFGELGAYREVDREIQMIDWEGLTPDRTSVIASIDYLVKLATNEIIKEAHAVCLAPQPFGPIHSSSANPQGEAASKIDYL
jgi:hypothetical protein